MVRDAGTWRAGTLLNCNPKPGWNVRSYDGMYDGERRFEGANLDVIFFTSRGPRAPVRDFRSLHDA